jgi:hemerythrin-like domain-containing protein
MEVAMEYDRMLAELFGEEDRAREMARRLGAIAQSSREAAAAERESLIAFVRGPMERHFQYEEHQLFPRLEERGLGPEVQVAVKQHAALRQLADRLEAPAPDDDVAQLIFDAARLMLHHTNFEGDYIYPELTHDDWRELMKETVREAAEGARVQPAAASPP